MIIEVTLIIVLLYPPASLRPTHDLCGNNPDILSYCDKNRWEKLIDLDSKRVQTLPRFKRRAGDSNPQVAEATN